MFRHYPTSVHETAKRREQAYAKDHEEDRIADARRGVALILAGVECLKEADAPDTKGILEALHDAITGLHGLIERDLCQVGLVPAHTVDLSEVEQAMEGK